jgi:F0F1-type ATP synthase epsilon subunit
MELHLVSPEDKRTLRVAWFEIDTPVGNFVIHLGHAPMMVTLLPEHDIIIRLQSGKEEIIHAHGGLVHVTRKRATIILSD